LSYIGRDISNLSDRAVLDSISTSATATFNLLLNSVAYVPSSAESLTVSLNGIIQSPGSSYSVSGSTIIFASSLQSTDVIDFILAERAITLTTIGSGTVTTSNIVDANVTTAKIADNAVTSAKLASGVLPTNTPSFSARMSGAQTLSNETYTKVDFDTEDFDTDGAYDHSTNQRFTVPSGKAGKYFFNCFLIADSASAAQLQNCQLAFYKNGSLFKKHDWSFNSNDILYAGLTLSSLMNLAVSDYIEVFVRISDASGSPVIDGSGTTLSEFSGFKLI